MKKISLIESKKFATYVKKNLVLMMIMHSVELHLTKLHLIKIIKVSGHCHCTGKYRAAAHGICNLRYKTPKKNSRSIS